MSRYINVDAFERAVMFSDDEDIQDVVYRLRDFPAADVVPMEFHERCMELEIKKRANMVEVVRCEDCIHWSKELEACYIHDFCEIFQNDYYCASGERKEDDEAHKHYKESRHGRWIIDEPIHMHSICSCCGYYNAYSPCYNYCPNCGAEMRGEDHE